MIDEKTSDEVEAGLMVVIIDIVDCLLGWSEKIEASWPLVRAPSMHYRP
jgi:hypothetical protein